MPEPSHNQAILSIAGSDPSGGAGIQADLKTFTALGVYGAAAITCLTAQNSLGVFDTLPVAPKFVAKQIDLVLADLPVSHIKTGMLGSDQIAQAIAGSLAGFTGEIICDPVLRASDGHSLFSASKQGRGLKALLNRATILTPNLPELSQLCDQAIQSREEALAAGRLLLDRHPRLRAIVITGGHLAEEDPEISDILLCRRGQQEPEIHVARHPRHRSRNTHGTGCTFAAAFAACHLLTSNDQEAFFTAITFMDRLLKQSADCAFGQGTGPLQHHLACGSR